MKHIVRVGVCREACRNSWEENKHIHTQTNKPTNKQTCQSTWETTAHPVCNRCTETLQSHKLLSCRHEWVTRHENQMKISFHKTLRFFCWASMPTDSPCLLSVNTDRGCAAHLGCNTQLAWCSLCMITTTDLLLSLTHTRTTSPLISVRPNCFNMHRWKAKLCWARPQPLWICWCHFNVLAGSFDAIRGSRNRKDTNSSPSWYLPKHNRHKHRTRLSYHSSIAGAERDARAAETLPRCQTQKVHGENRGWEAHNMR